MIIYFDTAYFQVKSIVPATITDAISTTSDPATSNTMGKVTMGANNSLGDPFTIPAGTILVTIVFTAQAGSSGNSSFTVDTAADIITAVDASSLDVAAGLDNTPATVTIPKSPISDVSKITAKVNAPQKDVALDTTVDLGSATAYNGTVEWYKGDAATGTDVTGPAAANQVYTAKITLTAKTADGESFDSSLGGKTTAEGYKIKFVDTSKLELTQTFDVTADKDPLTGSVSLSSTAWRIGNSMNVGTSGITSTSPGTLSYKWYRVDHEGNESLIAGESGDSYTPNDAADVGKTIKVVVTAENYSGRLEATSSYTVSKKPYDGPTPTEPTGINPTSNFVSFTTTENYYYAVTPAAITTAPSSGWTNQDGFTGLSPNTKYRLW